MNKTVSKFRDTQGLSGIKSNNNDLNDVLKIKKKNHKTFRNTIILPQNNIGSSRIILFLADNFNSQNEEKEKGS